METGAKGLWLVKPPSLADEIEVRNINETEEVAKKIVVELIDSHGYSFH
jgi:predicted aspartyl protease